ncbi:YncE family protein [Kosakonia oryzendophytica]|uniref:7-bladed beta-propeller protein YncE n=1 Tax=Kosakonia oryzendophytica TaxID=1005665 RepID=UPI003D32F1B4
MKITALFPPKTVRRFTLTLTLLMSTLCAQATSAEDAFLSATPGPGLYELSVDSRQNALFVAAAPSFDKDKTQGLIYRLNPTTLTTVDSWPTRRRVFATALDAENHRLYLGNTLEGSVTVVDTRNGKELATLQLSDAQKPEDRVHTREMVLDKQRQRLYVSGVTEKGIVWVVDTQNLTLLTTVENMGKYPTGLAIDSAKNSVYVVNGDNEIITIDAQKNTLAARHKVDADKKHFFLNIALDSKTNRAFITDPDLPGVLVIRPDSGKLIHRIDVPNSLAVLFNPVRNEVYISHRTAKLISIVDADTYKVKATLPTRMLPNSLALSADGQSLYASIKQGEKEMSKQPDDVIKIALGTF